MAHADPLVSIIIPTYNRADYLREAIESAQRQTYRNIEICVYDDASTDRTGEVVESFLADGRIRYERNETNLGLVGNWRKGIEGSRGEYFSIVGDDDLLDAAYVERLIEPLRNDSSATLSFCDHWVIDAGGRTLAHESEENSLRWLRAERTAGPVDDLYRIALVDRAIFIGACLFRRQDIDADAIADESTAFLDFWLFYLAARSGKRAHYINERLAYCRWQDTGVSRNWSWRVFGFPGEIFCYRRMLEDPKMAPYRNLFRKRLADSLRTYGNTLLTLGRNREAGAALRESLELQGSWTARYALALGRLGKPGALMFRLSRSVRDRLAR